MLVQTGADVRRTWGVRRCLCGGRAGLGALHLLRLQQLVQTLRLPAYLLHANKGIDQRSCSQHVSAQRSAAAGALPACTPPAGRSMNSCMTQLQEHPASNHHRHRGCLTAVQPAAYMLPSGSTPAAEVPL